DRCAALYCVLERFQDEDASTFANNEAVTVCVKRPAGGRGIIVARGKCFHRSESAYAHRGNCRFGATADHHVGRAAFDNLERVTHGVRRSRASRGGSGIGPLGTVTNGNVSGGQVHNGGRNEKGRNLVRTAVQQLAVLAFDDVESADAGRDVHANFFQV